MTEVQLAVWQAQIILNGFFGIYMISSAQATKPALKLPLEEIEAMLQRIRDSKSALYKLQRSRAALEWARFKDEQLVIGFSGIEVDDILTVLHRAIQDEKSSPADIHTIVGKSDAIRGVAEVLQNARRALQD